MDGYVDKPPCGQRAFGALTGGALAGPDGPRR